VADRATNAARVLRFRKPALFSRPFFEDKSRAFWMLQAVGWSGYLVLRSVSILSNGLSGKGLINAIIASIVGYCLTLLLSALYGVYRRLPRISSVLLSIATLATFTIIYSVLGAFTSSLIYDASPGITITLVLTTIFLNFIVLAGWSALYFGINFYLVV